MKLYHEKDAPKLDTSQKVPAGQYKVGIDVLAGEYKVTADDGGYIEVAKSSRGLKSIITNKAMYQAGNMYSGEWAIFHVKESGSSISEF